MHRSYDMQVVQPEFKYIEKERTTLLPVPHSSNFGVAHLPAEVRLKLRQCYGCGGVHTFFCSWKIPYIKASDVGGPSIDALAKLPGGEGVYLRDRWKKRLTSRNIDINRHDPVTSPRDRVAIMIVAPSIGTAPHADNPPRIRHLIVDLPQRGRHLVGQGARHDHDV
jgi:hypothetical protein